MRRVTSAAWLTLGTVLIGGGFAVGVAYWGFTLQDSGGPGFWEAPGFVSVALLGMGALALAVGFFRKDRPDQAATSVASQTARTAPGGQTTQVANVTSEGDVTIAPEQRNG